MCGVLQGNVLPAGLDLGSISALAAALGVQSVALPGSYSSPSVPLEHLVLHCDSPVLACQYHGLNT